MKTKIVIQLTEEMLGTKAANKDVFTDFIASKHPSGTPQKDELDTAEHREEAGTTVFHRMSRADLFKTDPKWGKVGPGENLTDMIIGIWDYQIKGFFKDACGSLNRCDTDERGGLEKLTAYKSKIDGCVFVFPRFIPMILPEGGKVGICERPLRAETAQGPRVSVCRSETVPIGTRMEFEVDIMSKDLKPYVNLWLNYGRLRGLGQWRNSSKGRFSHVVLD